MEFSYVLVVFTYFLQALTVSGKKSSKTKYKMDISFQFNEFSFDMYKEIVRGTDGNVLFSPFSIFTALTMIGIGARGTTQNEISAALKWGKIEKLIKSIKTLYADMSSTNNKTGSNLAIANNIWVSKNTEILTPYKEALTYYFQTEIGNEPFSTHPEIARDNINKWVAKRTNEYIKKMFPVRSIDSSTRLVFGNAISFKGIWAKPFDVKDTEKGKFYLANGRSIEVSYITREDKFPAYYDDSRGVQLLEIMYGDHAYSMFFVIPTKRRIDEIEDIINASVLSEWVSALSATNGNNWSSKSVYIPKFQIEQSLSLPKILQGLKIRTVFSPSEADLSGINGEKNLYCSTAEHISFVQVDETGTIGSAATSFSIRRLSMPMDIRLERPFLFYIIHKKSNVILFSGKVMNPTHSKSPGLFEDISSDSPEDTLYSETNSAPIIFIPIILIMSPILSMMLPWLLLV